MKGVADPKKRVVWIQYTNVTDGRTDGRTDGHRPTANTLPTRIRLAVKKILRFAILAHTTRLNVYNNNNNNKQEAQLMRTNPRDAFIGHSGSPDHE